jgi:hypothetical protein
MAANLAIVLTEQTFTVLSHEASVAGKTPAELAAAVVERTYGRRHCESVEAANARSQFEQFFGSVDIGQPVGVANDAIDADLSREYASGTE